MRFVPDWFYRVLFFVLFLGVLAAILVPRLRPHEKKREAAPAPVLLRKAGAARP